MNTVLLIQSYGNKLKLCVEELIVFAVSRTAGLVVILRWMAIFISTGINTAVDVNYILKNEKKRVKHVNGFACRL